MKSFLAYAFGFALFLFAIGYAVLTKAQPHTTSTDVIVGGALLGAFVCIAPASAKDAVGTLKQLLPWTQKNRTAEAKLPGEPGGPVA